MCIRDSDYLGALLNLGVDRSVIGDIVVQKKAAWFFCQNKMTDVYKRQLMDYGDMIVHVFDEENRLFYDLERIWRDGKVLDVNEFLEK